MTRKITKSQRRKIEKIAKKHPFLAFIAFLLVVVIVGLYLHWSRTFTIPFLVGVVPQKQELNDSVSSKGGAFTEEDILAINNSDFSIHFLELGNKYTGDSTLIKVGDVEVLIDAGSRQNSAVTLKNYIDTYCTDGVLEYVIATHAHQDHIAGFVGNKDGDSRTGIFYQYKIGTLIQFARSDLSLKTEKGNDTLYATYLESVEYLKTQDTTVYTALQCYNNADGAKRSYYLDSENTVSMNILYNYFYDHESFGGGEENEYSVCMLLSDEREDKHYLFTGDLEAKGEEYLVENNNLPKCELFKGGHHGSYTATTEKLLSVIQPRIVCVCCCCGSDEYAKANPENRFPAQAFVDRVSKYTSQIYVTTMIADNDAGYQSMNGNIVLSSNAGELVLRCSNNNTLFKDTDWFKNNRTWTGGK